MAILVKNLSLLSLTGNKADVNNQYLYCTNVQTTADTKLRLTDLIKTFRSVGEGKSIILKDSSSEVTFKSLSVSHPALQLRDTGGSLSVGVLPANLDLSSCKNTVSLFLNTVDLTKDVKTTLLPTANGGTNKSSAWVVGDIVYASATNTLASITAAASNNVLLSAGTGTIPAYGKVGLTTHVSGTLPAANGGTGVASTLARAVLIGNGSAAMTPSGAATAGQVLIGSAAGNPAFANIASSDSSIVITNGNNTIDIATRAAKLKLADGTDMVSSTGTNTQTAADKTFGYQRRIINITGSTKAVSAAESGAIFTLSRGGGMVITLPSAAAGLVYEFHILTTFTGTLELNAYSSADTYMGSVLHHDKDEKGSVVALNEALTTSGWNIPAATDYRLHLNADTDGRFLGGKLRCTAITAAIWHVEGTLFGDGAVTHIFS